MLRICCAKASSGAMRSRTNGAMDNLTAYGKGCSHAPTQEQEQHQRAQPSSLPLLFSPLPPHSIALLHRPWPVRRRPAADKSACRCRKTLHRAPDKPRHKSRRIARRLNGRTHRSLALQWTGRFASTTWSARSTPPTSASSTAPTRRSTATSRGRRPTTLSTSSATAASPRTTSAFSYGMAR